VAIVIIIIEYMILAVSSYVLQVHCTAIFIPIHHLPLHFMSDKYYPCRNSLYFIRDLDMHPVHQLLVVTVIGMHRMKIVGKVTTFTGVLNTLI